MDFVMKIESNDINGALIDDHKSLVMQDSLNKFEINYV